VTIGLIASAQVQCHPPAQQVGLRRLGRAKLLKLRRHPAGRAEQRD
jgi:hypothetical protein